MMDGTIAIPAVGLVVVRIQAIDARQRLDPDRPNATA
jgi:hypothetical protein